MHILSRERHQKGKKTTDLSIRKGGCYTKTADEQDYHKHRSSCSQSTGVVEDQQTGGLRQQHGEMPQVIKPRRVSLSRDGANAGKEQGDQSLR